LQAPKEFFQNGRIAFLPHNVYANMPLGSEMFSLASMVLLGDWWYGALAGKGIIAACSLLAATGLYAAGRRLFSPGAGILAALIYLALPWTGYESQRGLIDVAMGSYLFLAVYAMLIESPSGSRSYAVPGYLAGAAAACKYPALLLVALPIAVWVMIRLRSLNWAAMIRQLVVFSLALMAGCGLWLAKNWAATGNPTYPLLYSMFDGRNWSPEQDQQWNRAHRPKDFSVPTLLGDLGRVGLRSDWLSPLVIPLAGLALLRRRERRTMLTLAAFFVYVIGAWWLTTHRIDRFWIPALPLLCLLAGGGGLWSAERLWQATLRVLLVFGLASGVLLAASETFSGGHFLVELARLRHDPERVGVWCDYFNSHVKQGKVLLVGEAQAFDYEVPVDYSTCFNRNLLETLAVGRTSREIHAELIAREITYVFVNWSEIARYRRPGNYGFTEFIQPELFARLVHDGVLEPLPTFPGVAGAGYRVVSDCEPRSSSLP
jgi:hypothetical protein